MFFNYECLDRCMRVTAKSLKESKDGFGFKGTFYIKPDHSQNHWLLT